MNKLRRICLLLLFCAGGLIVRGQGTHPDFYANLQGDIWKYSLAQNTAVQLTHSGYNGGPILSPAGGKFAFLETAPTFLVRFKAGAAQQTAGSPPADIWVYDIASQTFSRVADQTGASPGGFLRSVPTWSPDGRQLAWLQIDPYIQPTERATLQVYSLDTGVSVSLAEDVDLGYQQRNIHMPTLLWGDGGIARTIPTSLNGGETPISWVEIFDAVSGARKRFHLGLASDAGDLARDFMWATHQGRAVLLLGIRDYWEALDPLDGSRTRLSDPPRLKNSFSVGGMELTPLAVAGEDGGWEFRWRAISGGLSYDTGYLSGDVDLDGLPALSSDGGQVVWHGGDRISIWHRGSAADARLLVEDSPAYRLFPIPAPRSIAWSPAQWVTTGVNATDQSAAASSPPANCALAPQLRPSQRAIVSPGLANRVRSAAGLGAAVVGRIQPGDVVDILEGPICSDGYHWYRVEKDRIRGWSAEGGDDYWLLYHVDCPQSPPTRLGNGMLAVVGPGKANFIRDGAGTRGSNIVGRMEAGSIFEITGYPRCDAEGMRWYPIQFGQVSGWTAAGWGDEYWIEPTDLRAAG